MSQSGRVRLRIDGETRFGRMGQRLVELLDGALPSLCHHPDLEGPRDCGLCAVEVDGELRSACAVPVHPGMDVEVAGAAPRRQEALATQLAHHVVDCPTCPVDGACSLQDLARVGEGASPSALTSAAPRALGAELLIRDDRCTGCGLCVAAARDVFAENGLQQKETSWGRRPQADGDLPALRGYAQSLMALCPTGALSQRASGTERPQRPARDWGQCRQETICSGCATGCAVTLTWSSEERGDRTRSRFQVEPRREPEVNASWLCDRAQGRWESLAAVEPASPAIDGRPAPRAEVLKLAALRLRQAHARGAGRILLVTSYDLANEEAWLLRRFLHEVLGEDRLLLLPRWGEDRADDFLRDADRHANRRGTLLLLGDAVAPESAAAAAEAEILVTVGWSLSRARSATADSGLVGQDSARLDDELLASLLAVPRRIEMATEPADRCGEGTEVFLPGRDGGASSGTRINRQARVQRFVAPDFRRAEPPGLIETLHDLAHTLGASLGSARDVETLWNQIVRLHPRFSSFAFEEEAS